MNNESTSFYRVTAEFLDKVQALESEVERLMKENEIMKAFLKTIEKLHPEQTLKELGGIN